MRASSTCNIGKTAEFVHFKEYIYICIDKTLRFMLTAFDSF